MGIKTNKLAVFRVSASGHWQSIGHVHDEDILLFDCRNLSEDQMRNVEKNLNVFIDNAFEHTKNLGITLKMDIDTYIELEYHFDDMLFCFRDDNLAEYLFALSSKDKRRFMHAMVYRVDDPHEIGISFEFRNVMEFESNESWKC